MKTVLTITDLTRMQGQRVCVAGVLADGTCVRPVFRSGVLLEDWLQVTRRTGWFWLRVEKQVAIRPFARVEFELEVHIPDPPHTEDWVIDPVYRKPCGLLSPDERQALLTQILDPSVESIFGVPLQRGYGYYILSKQGKRSLGTIQPQQISAVTFGPGAKEATKWDYRLAFTDAAGQSYQCAVTDLAFRYFLDSLHTGDHLSPAEAAHRLTETLQQAQVFLRIGLARGWEKFPDRCYLQITGVHSFPDYLAGRCFADFVSQDGSLRSE